jgi:hypothetical protein
MIFLSSALFTIIQIVHLVDKKKHFTKILEHKNNIYYNAKQDTLLPTLNLR